MVSQIFTEEQFWKLCDCHCSEPVLLSKADLTKSFVYDRKYGLFYVPFGYHQMTMATLLAFQHDLVSPIDVADKLKITFGSYALADHWLENTEGAAFKSSVSTTVCAGKRGNLNASEIRHLKRAGKIEYLFTNP